MIMLVLALSVAVIAPREVVLTVLVVGCYFGDFRYSDFGQSKGSTRAACFD